MTLSELIDYVCGICGQNDTTTRELVRTFIATKYNLVYDAFPWRDAEMQATLSISERGIASIPDDMDRVISIRSNGDTLLQPVDLDTLFQTNPTIFEEHGLPLYYREYNNSGRKIEVYPKPSMEQSVDLLIAGKRTADVLEDDTDEPRLRNIDNVLLGYGVYDLLRRQRQWDKSNLALQAADAALTVAKNLEQEQANKPRLSKPLTIAGNSLAEFTDQVCAITGRWGLDDVVLIKNFLRSNYQMIWDACNWSEATVQATVNNDGPEVILPSYFDRVISVRFDPNMPQLGVTEPSLLFGIAPCVFEQTGNALVYSYLSSVGVKFLPPARERLSIHSTSNSDKSPVFIMGEIEGDVLSETLNLNGTVPVNTRNEYDTPLTVSKGITVGNMVIEGLTSGITLETVLYNERERKHIRLWLNPTPSSAQVLMVLGKRTISPFATDQDTTMLRDIGATLIAAAAADMFMRVGDKDSSADQRKQSQDALKTLLDLETNQGAYSARVIPYTEGVYTDWGPSLTKAGWMY